MNVLSDGKTEFVEIQLLEKMQDGVDYNFYVDEDVFGEDNAKAYFSKGVFT